MSRVSYGSKSSHSRTAVVKDKKPQRSPEDVVRELKKEQQKPRGEDYRERALAIYGLVCAHCGREFDNAHRHLLTVHHKDGNHNNNPPDGSNWEPLCVYCHENTHSREILGQYLDGSGHREESLAYKDEADSSLGTLADKLKKVLDKKAKSRS